MSYFTLEEKSQIVKDLLKQYIFSSLEGEGVKIDMDEIQCMENTIGFEECHVIYEGDLKEFDVNRDSISSGAEVPSFVNDFTVYMCWHKIDARKVIFRVWAYWGDIEFK